MHYQTGEAWLRRQLTREAIDLAMQGRWEETIATNKNIIGVANIDPIEIKQMCLSALLLAIFTFMEFAH